ncbi:helicase HerA domain-containing protein [Bergeyella porcorum]|uniref:ATP-binding protein n=1 Tax=Bergeyella porcorum TaxID=1735111 RepID=UPI0035E813DD
MSKELNLYNPNIEINNIKFDFQKLYLNEEFSIVPSGLSLSITDNELRNIRFFHSTKFVYEKDIKISYKLSSVFTALHSVEASLIVKLISDGKKCDILVGVKSDTRITDKQKVLAGAITGNFPGSSFSNKEKPLSNDEVKRNNKKVFGNCKEITAVVGIPSIKNKEEEHFIQGIENLILGMNGKAFSALFIADPVHSTVVETTIDAYEKVYSVLSSEQEFVTTDGTNESTSTSTSLSTSASESKTIGTSMSNTKGKSESTSESNTTGENKSTNITKQPWIGKKKWLAIVGGITRGTSTSTSSSTTTGKTFGTNTSETFGTNESETKGTSKSTSESNSNTQGTSTSLQKTFTNKKMVNFLEDLELQIKRLKQGKGTGFWNIGAYFISEEEQNSVIAANIYNGVIKGSESNFETNAIKTYNALNKEEREKVVQYLTHYEIPQIEDYGYLAQAVTTDEMTIQINFPHKSVIGLDVVEVTPFGNNPYYNDEKSIKVGNLYNYDQEYSIPITLDYNKFTSHIFVTGSTGSGKSNVTYNLIDKLLKQNITFLVIEPAKGEYKDEFGGRKDVSVYGTNSNYTELLKINPFQFPDGIHIYEHISRFIEILNACWPMEAAMPNLLKEAVEDAYITKGWILDESRCIYGKQFPTFSDLLKSLERIIQQSKFSQEIKSNYEGALVTRVRSMTNGINRLIFTEKGLSDEELFDKNVIVDLSRVASSEEKALFMGLIFMKLNQYRIATKQGNNSDLKHITIIEEAHNLLKRTSTEQSNDGANLAGKSVEMISNAIAEMRTYGEGFIIADQAPGLLDMSVIRNTNTKICLRLPDFEDRKLVGNAMNLSDEQIKELASLERGVAAIYQNDWQEAILCKFDKYESNNKEFIHHPNQNERSESIQHCISLLDSVTEYDDSKLKKINDTLLFDFFSKHLILIVNKESYSDNLKKNELIKILKSALQINDEQSKKVLQYFLIQILGAEEDTSSKEIIRKIMTKI